MMNRLDGLAVRGCPPRLLPYLFFAPLKIVAGVAIEGTPMLAGAVHMMSTF